MSISEPEVRPTPAWKQGVTIEDLFVVIAVFVGLVMGLHPIADNTMLLHLRTGIDMVANHQVPSTDPYSFTAHGEPWIVQSWLAEGIYGSLHALGTTRLVIIFNAVMLATLAAGLVSMVRTGRSGRTFLCALLVLMLGIEQWGIRPTTFGFVAFFVLVATRNRSIWWVVPLGVLWVNTHGSWPLGMVWLGALIVGRFIDTRSLPRPELRRAGVFVLALIVGGVINPVGWRLLVFPFKSLTENSRVFAEILEWMSPNFHALTTWSGGAILACVCALTLVLALNKLTWAQALPVVALLVLSLYSQRNLPILAIALAPLLGDVFRVDPDEITSTRSWGYIEIIASVFLSVVSVSVIARTVFSDPYVFSSYPVAGVAYAESIGLQDRNGGLLAPDFVGCYRILREGTHAAVFIDDRYDMYPSRVADDYDTMQKLRPRAGEILDGYKFRGVLWQKKRALSTYLSISPQWRLAWSDEDWVLYERVK